MGNNIKFYVSGERLEKYKPFMPNLFNELCDAAEVIRQSDEHLKYLEFLINLVYGNWPDGFELKNEEGNLVLNFAPMFALLAHIEKCEQEMENRGFSDNTKSSVLAFFEGILVDNKKKHGYFACTQTMFLWAKRYLKPNLFQIGNLQFELMEFNRDEVFESSNGSLIPVRNPENAGEFITGTSILRGGADGEQITFKGKSVLKQGDYVLSVHIPTGADISKESYTKDYKDASAFFAKHYPECDIKAFICQSWLMDPELDTCVNENSRILEFQRYFTPVCVKSSGLEVIYNIFYDVPEDYNELPETSTLTKNLKNRYLNNNPIYSHVGIKLI